MTSRNLLLVVCGAGPAGDAHRLVALAKERGWTVAVTATANALPFIDTDALSPSTGFTVRSSFTDGSDRRRLDSVQALIVAPATFNTINKIALGIADTYALTSIAGHLGAGLPTVVVPFVNSALASRAPFQRAVRMLREEGGVRVLFGADDGWEPHLPGTGQERFADFPWDRALAEAEAMTGR